MMAADGTSSSRAASASSIALMHEPAREENDVRCHCVATVDGNEGALAAGKKAPLESGACLPLLEIGVAESVEHL